MTKQFVLEIDYDKEDADWLHSLRDKGDDDKVRKEMPTPPRPGLVFDRNRHRWIRPNKDDGEPEETPEQTDFFLSPVEGLEEEVSMLNRSLVELQEGQRFREPLMMSFRYDKPGMTELMHRYLNNAFKLIEKNEGEQAYNQFQKFSIFLGSEVGYFPSDDPVIENLIERTLTLSEKKGYDQRFIEDNEGRASNELFYTNAGSKYTKTLLRHAKTFGDLHQISEFHLYNKAVPSEFLVAFENVMENEVGKLRGVNFALLSLIKCSRDCKPSDINSVRNLTDLFMFSFEDEIERAQYMSNFEELSDQILARARIVNWIGTEAITRFAKTGKLSLDPTNGFRKALENLPDFQTENPGRMARQAVDELFKETDLLDVHASLRSDWEHDSSSVGGILISEMVAKKYDERRKKYRESHIDYFPTSLQRSLGEDRVERYIEMHYELTQQMLDYSFPDEDTLTLYRGTTIRELNPPDRPPSASGPFSSGATDEEKFEDDLRSGRLKRGQEISADSNSVSSWTLDEAVARKFARNNGPRGITLKSVVPKSSIWGYAASYCYEGNEREFLLIRKPTNKYYFNHSNMRE